MAVVDRADSDAVPELGLPLNPHPSPKSVNRFSINLHADGDKRSYGPISDGVGGSDGEGGKLMIVGVVMLGKKGRLIQVPQ
jgi:hypothetical protein